VGCVRGFVCVGLSVDGLVMVYGGGVHQYVDLLLVVMMCVWVVGSGWCFLGVDMFVCVCVCLCVCVSTSVCV